ncbi:MAG: hypothetical protein ABIE03_01545 [Patescibacteria group bacterium]|nr:hypothetical protein [Patescibacteria group bacterium]
MTNETIQVEIAPVNRIQEVFYRATGQVCYRLLGPETSDRVLDWGIRAYERIVAAYPEDGVALGRLGNLHLFKAFRTAEFDQGPGSVLNSDSAEIVLAGNYLEEAVKFNSEDLSLKLSLAIAKMCQEALSAANSLFLEIINKSRDPVLIAVAYFNMAILYEAVGNQNTAIQLYASAAKSVGNLLLAINDHSYFDLYVMSRLSLREKMGFQSETIKGVNFKDIVLVPLRFLEKRFPERVKALREYSRKTLFLMRGGKPQILARRGR